MGTLFFANDSFMIFNRGKISSLLQCFIVVEDISSIAADGSDFSDLIVCCISIADVGRRILKLVIGYRFGTSSVALFIRWLSLRVSFLTLTKIVWKWLAIYAASVTSFPNRSWRSVFDVLFVFFLLHL